MGRDKGKRRGRWRGRDKGKRRGRVIPFSFLFFLSVGCPVAQILNLNPTYLAEGLRYLAVQEIDDI